MGAAVLPLSPTGSLPPLRRPDTFTEDQVLSGLQNLENIYCPIALSLALQSPKKAKKNPPPVAFTPPVDSGYVSENENENDNENAEKVKQALEMLRADAFERDFAIRWLTSFVSRAEEMILIPDEARQLAVDKAYCILESFTSTSDENDQEDEGIARDFSFTLCSSAPSPVTGSYENAISVRLNDGPLASTDHTAVGLESFASSIILSKLMCSSPGRFGLEDLAKKASPRIIELGAGTGLVGLVLAHMLPHLGDAQPTLIATDFHPVVLENLRTNIANNFPGLGNPPVDVCHLDWSAPSHAPPLDRPADMLVATDVIYAPEHAVWLRDCAAQLLAPDGVFWILIAVRTTGRFEGISDTVETAFAASECPKDADGRLLSILSSEALEKPAGLGRGDESSYKLFRVGWE